MVMMKRVLTIAGSDSGGGAGIQADLKTFSAFGVYGMSVITAVTAQNTLRVNGITGIPPKFVGLQFESVLADIGADGVKTGMLYTPEIVQIVAHKIHKSRIPHVVVDPVLVAKDGSSLLERRAIDVLKHDLFPLATVVTPNIPEAELFADMPIQSLDDMKEAAQIMVNRGCRAVLIKGGHLEGQAVDILFDGDVFSSWTSPRIETRNTHGTGCTLSAGIVANLVQGKSLKQAVGISKMFVTKAIQNALSLGKGQGPLNHFVRIDGMEEADDG